MDPGAGLLPEHIIARFRSLALERLARLEACWIALTNHPDDEQLAEELLGVLHTLKGDARLVGFTDVHLLCHKLEEVIELARLLEFQVPEELDLVVSMAVRFMAMLIRKKSGHALGGIDLPGFIEQVDDMVREVRAAQPLVPSDRAPTTRPDAPRVEAPDRLSPRGRQRIAAAATIVFLEQLAASGRARARLGDAWTRLSRQIAGFDAVPLATRLARHEYAAAALARDLGKQITISVDAGDLCVRIEVADALDCAVLHLIRNAVDHGIELPARRRDRRKDAAGHIVVRAREAADCVEVHVEDDGAGVDFEAVRRRALDLGRLRAEHLPLVSEQELLEMVMQPGFSTRRKVNEVSGRGIGLGTVREEIERQGGTTSLKANAGQGLTAILRVPRGSARIQVHRFEAAGMPLPLCVPATWSVSLPDTLDTVALDPLEALGLGSVITTASPAFILELRSGAHRVLLRAGGPPERTSATRFCSTSDVDPVEVVHIDGVETLMLRPAVLDYEQSQGRIGKGEAR